MKLWSASLFGLKVGSDTIARTLPVFGLDRHDGALHVGAERAQPVERRLLRRGVDRGQHVAALGGVAVDQVDEAVDEQAVVLAGEEGVLRCARAPVSLPKVYQPVTGAYMNGLG